MGSNQKVSNEEVLQALRKHKWHFSRAGKELGISASAVHSRIKNYIEIELEYITHMEKYWAGRRLYAEGRKKLKEEIGRM